MVLLDRLGFLGTHSPILRRNVDFLNTLVHDDRILVSPTAGQTESNRDPPIRSKRYTVALRKIEQRRMIEGIDKCQIHQTKKYDRERRLF